jgi:hypothetical protein
MKQVCESFGEGVALINEGELVLVRLAQALARSGRPAA